MASLPSAIASSPSRIAPSSVRMTSSVRPRSMLRAAWKENISWIKFAWSRPRVSRCSLAAKARQLRAHFDVAFLPDVGLTLQHLLQKTAVRQVLLGGLLGQRFIAVRHFGQAQALHQQ